MILVDFVGHLVSTESEEELHEFALMKLGLDKQWYQNSGKLLKHPHYDLTTFSKIEHAKANGAESVSPQDLIRRAWWRSEGS